jgi:hypothetical protein
MLWGGRTHRDTPQNPDGLPGIHPVRGISDMRYRIQIHPMMGSTLCVVSTYDELGAVCRITTKMYTIDEDFHYGDALVEILGRLQQMMAESQS